MRERARSTVGATAVATRPWLDAARRGARTETLGVRVDATDATLILQAFTSAIAHHRGMLVSFVNPSSPATARCNPGYRADLREFDIVAPDGVGMCFAMRRLHPGVSRRVSFDNTSLAPLVFTHAEHGGLSVALVGGRAGVAERAAANLHGAYPSLSIVATLDGYGGERDHIAKLCALDPKIVVCGMGAGRQERFLLQLRAAGWRGIGFTCGGFLDQLRDGCRYYPAWVDRANLRWAYRLLREPRRLWRRYLIDYSRFAIALGLALVERESREIGLLARGRPTR